MKEYYFLGTGQDRGPKFLLSLGSSLPFYSSNRHSSGLDG